MIKFNLKKVMKNKKMTLKELSTKTNLSINTLSLLSTGKSKGIQFDTLEKLINALDCQIVDLITIEDYYTTLEFKKIEIFQEDILSPYTNDINNNETFLVCTYLDELKFEKRILLTLKYFENFIEVLLAGDFPKDVLTSKKKFTAFDNEPTSSSFFTNLYSFFIEMILKIAIEENYNYFDKNDWLNKKIRFNFLPYVYTVQTTGLTLKKLREFEIDKLITMNYLGSKTKDFVSVENNVIKISNDFYKEDI